MTDQVAYHYLMTSRVGARCRCAAASLSMTASADDLSASVTFPQSPVAHGFFFHSIETLVVVGSSFMCASAIFPVRIGSSRVTSVCGVVGAVLELDVHAEAKLFESKRVQSTPISSPTRWASSLVVRRVSDITSSWICWPTAVSESSSRPLWAALVTGFEIKPLCYRAIYRVEKLSVVHTQLPSMQSPQAAARSRGAPSRVSVTSTLSRVASE